jgi:hypothetical protein
MARSAGAGARKREAPQSPVFCGIAAKNAQKMTEKVNVDALLPGPRIVMFNFISPMIK